MNVRFASALLGLALTLGVGAPVLAQDTPAGKPKETLQQKIDRLIKELGSDGYDAREKAQKDLEAIGKPAVPALQKAAKSKDLEIASRAADALSKINKTRKAPPIEGPTPKRDPFRPPPPPDMDEVLKELEKQMPEGFGKIFRQFFPNGQDPRQQPQPGQKDEERKGGNGMGNSRVRTWTFTLGPDGRLKRRGVQQLSQGVGDAMGLSTGPASAALRAQLEIAPGEGRVVNRLEKGGWADQHGVELYDVIVGIDGRAVRRTKDLEPLLKKACKVEVFRKAKLHVLDLPKIAQGDATKERKKPAPKVEKDAQGRKQRSF
jgi:hypothetical protein